MTTIPREIVAQAPEYVSCPFCKENDFDLIGFKEHFEKGCCEVYNDVVVERQPWER